MQTQSKRQRNERCAGAATGGTHHQQITALHIPALWNLPLLMRDISKCKKHSSALNSANIQGISVSCSRIIIRVSEPRKGHALPQSIRPDLTGLPYTLFSTSLDDGINEVVKIVRIGFLRLRESPWCFRDPKNIGGTQLNRCTFNDAAEPGYQRGLDGGDVGLPQFDVGAAHLRALNRCGVRHLNHVGGVFFGLHTQRYTQVGVCQNIVVHHAGGPLGCQDHVHAKGSAHSANTHK